MGLECWMVLLSCFSLSIKAIPFRFTYATVAVSVLHCSVYLMREKELLMLGHLYCNHE